MEKDPLIVKMGKEVFDRFLPSEKETFSYPAFIFAFKKIIKKKKNKGKSGFGPGTYGYFKRATEDEVKYLIKKHNCPPKPARKICVPKRRSINPSELKHNLDLF